ncbi:MAG: 50S ribosomal protein L23 [Oscillospiraceae bacterium]|jgi:large subunit ribosomal protein L23|nr:50S ribosomal protein L23 [Oscillospiraceae bacterium]
MNRLPQDIIVKPVITERSVDLLEQGKYTFRVAKDANKFEIKSAVETLFNVDVASVHTMNVRGRIKKMGRFEGKTASWKKAIVTLKGDKTIEFFDSLH